MSDCNECLYSVDGICQNDGCSFDLEDNCYEFVSKTTYDNGYQKGKSNAFNEILNEMRKSPFASDKVTFVKKYIEEQIKEQNGK